MTGALAGDRQPVRAMLLWAIGFYQQAISPTRPPRCRFVPSCSEYALEAVQRHGAARGSWLAARRLARCAPWHPGGVDLVPRPVPDVAPSPAVVGTDQGGRSSSSSAPVAASPVDGDARSDRFRAPARHRALEEESSRA